MQVVVWLVLAGVVGLNAWATALIVRGEDDPQRRRLQLLLVWLVPLIGAGAVAFVHRSPTRSPDPELDYGKSTRDASEYTLND